VKDIKITWPEEPKVKARAVQLEKLRGVPNGQGETHLPLKPENLVVAAVVREELPWLRFATVSGGRTRPAIANAAGAR